MQTIPSCSSKASVIVLCRKIRRLGESKQPCLTSPVVKNHSHILPLKYIAVEGFLWRLSMILIRLALMLYSFMLSHNAARQTLSKAFLKLEIYEDMVEVLMLLKVLSHGSFRWKIFSVVLCPGRKPACSSAKTVSAVASVYSI
ncbi:hypothetical protein PoB_004580400 [Plakobranchus ocellatus]|uniref:Uncharacterized protein n=1 Tax=Plakobranchus ocellatus TaxID=259542 RepID=A0AAV4BK50_9GAST|nr:hypothetical protein PoB_004580400 [Plakobranchus ocellatus]